MALGAIPPWLDVTPELFLGAAKAGAQAGLEQRGQDIKQSEAANQLRLAYASLASQEERAAQATQAQQELAAAKLQMAQEQANQLHQYREQGLAEKEKSMAGENQRAAAALAQRQQMGDQVFGLKEKQAESLNQSREQGLGLREESIKNLQTANQARLDAREASRKLREQKMNSDLELKRQALDSKLSDPQKELLKADASELKAIEKKRDTMEVHGWGPTHLFGGNKQEYEDLGKRAEQLRAKIASYAPAKSDRVRVKHESGKVGTIPADQVDAAIASKKYSILDESPSTDETSDDSENE